MLETALERKNIKFGVKITVKALISAGVIALAVILPQLVHLFSGAAGGAKWLPMYLPVLIGGCLLGWRWGLGVGVLSPVVSFLITSMTGNAMPAASRLPYLIAELAVFAVVSGVFSKKISENLWLAFPAVLLAQVSGRAVFLMVAAIFQSIAPLSAAAVWSQIQTGLLGFGFAGGAGTLYRDGARRAARQRRSEEMKGDLEKAKELFAQGGYTCVLVGGGREVVGRERGILPLIKWIEEKSDFRGFAAADKIVGKAAALLYALMGIEALYAEVLSEGAEDVLRRFRILTEYEKIVPAIINRKGTEFAPWRRP